MSVVTEIRNTQPNYKDKCELVIGNPCFNNRFYSVMNIENISAKRKTYLSDFYFYFE